MPKISVLAQKMRPCTPPPSTVMVLEPSPLTSIAFTIDFIIGRQKKFYLY